MEKVKIGLFDALGFILPGTILLMSILIALTPDLNTIEDIRKVKLTFDWANLSIGLIIAYVTGYATHNFGYYLHSRVGLKLWKLPDDIKSDVSGSEMNVLLREKSPNNMEYLEKWNALRAMSHNLSFSFIFLSIVCFIKAIMNYKCFLLQWLVFGLILLALAYQLLRRAYYYHIWFYRDRKNAFKMVTKETTTDANGR